MPDLKEELREKIIEEIQLDSLIQNHIDKLDEKHKSEIEDTGVYADWFPLNDVKKDIKKEIVNVIQFEKTKPLGSNPKILSRNKRIYKAYDKLTNKGRKQIEAERLLAKEFELSPQTIRKIVKDPQNTL